jgi:quinol monooxygenase YgiN
VIVVISELWPHPDRRGDYDKLAAELLPYMEAIDGFISAERFESCNEPGKFLSLSVWRDEAALARSVCRTIASLARACESARSALVRLLQGYVRQWMLIS